MSKRVLVVEDNVIMREVMLTHLNNLKVNCYAVTTGEEAIDLAEYFDLILMDIDLPGINGVEAARQIREREEQNCLEPAVIVATTSGDNESECLAAGINEFQQKPLYRVDVKTIVERWLLSRPRKKRSLG
ncbi:MAG: response regulator [Candidatus Melainabacteria bacterium]|jgi:CheY-like chemotaxis protein|nr:response regulator [Candidatus Melainabacteria bacterium]